MKKLILDKEEVIKLLEDYYRKNGKKQVEVKFERMLMISPVRSDYTSVFTLSEIACARGMWKYHNKRLISFNEIEDIIKECFLLEGYEVSEIAMDFNEYSSEATISFNDKPKTKKLIKK